MAAFATVAAAGLRATAKGPAGDRTWLYAHAGVTAAGAPCVRVMRPMTNSFALTQVAWVEITDDGTT
jgi:hypothetical protein